MRAHRIRLLSALLSLAFLVTCASPQRHDRATRARPVMRLDLLRPDVVGRSAWHAEKAVGGPPVYDTSVRAVFVHHTDNPNDYDCRTDVPAMLRAIEQRHIHDLGWDDLGYNFVVDKCGTVYEGRAGGVDRAVRGAHTEGFNTDTVGIAALGTFGPGVPVPAPMLRSIAAIAAWKLAPSVDAAGRVRLTSSNDESRFPKGTSVVLHAISGHRDVYETTCPGDALYAKLPWIRQEAARLRRTVVRTG